MRLGLDLYSWAVSPCSMFRHQNPREIHTPSMSLAFTLKQKLDQSGCLMLPGGWNNYEQVIFAMNTGEQDPIYDIFLWSCLLLMS